MHTGNTENFSQHNPSFIWTNEAQKVLLEKYAISIKDLAQIPGTKYNKHIFNGDQTKQDFDMMIRDNFYCKDGDASSAYLVVESEEGPLSETARLHGMNTMTADNFQKVYHATMLTLI